MPYHRASSAASSATQRTRTNYHPLALLKQQTYSSTISTISASLNASLAPLYEPISEPLPGSPHLTHRGEAVLPPLGIASKADAKGKASTPTPRLVTQEDQEEDLFLQMLRSRQELIKQQQEEEDSEQKKKAAKAATTSLEAQRRIKRSETAELIEKLRKNPEAFEEYSVGVEESLQAAKEKRKLHCKFDAENRHREELRSFTPVESSKILQERASRLQQQLQLAKVQRQAIKEERMRHFQAQVDRVHRRMEEHDAGFDLKVHTEAVQEVCDLWVSFTVMAAFANRLNRIVAEERAAAQESAARLQLVSRSLHQVMTLQCWWKRIQWRRRIMARKQGAFVILNYLRTCPRLKTQFRLMMTTLRNRVVSVQRHYRAVCHVRRLRKEHAVSLIDKCVVKELSGIEGKIQALLRDQKLAETKARAAIMARKPLFEGQAKECAAKVHQLRLKRNDLQAFTRESKEALVLDTLEEKKQKYNELVSHVAHKLWDKYQFEHAKDRLMKRKGNEFIKEVSMKGITDRTVRVETENDVRRLMKKRFQRPSLCVNLTEEEAEDLYHSHGATLAHGDFLAYQDRMTAGECDWPPPGFVAVVASHSNSNTSLLQDAPLTSVASLTSLAGRPLTSQASSKAFASMQSLRGGVPSGKGLGPLDSTVSGQFEASESFSSLGATTRERKSPKK